MYPGYLPSSFLRSVKRSIREDGNLLISTMGYRVIGIAGGRVGRMGLYTDYLEGNAFTFKMCSVLDGKS